MAKLVFQSGLSSGKARDRNSEGRARHVSETNLVAEWSSCGVATMFATFANVHFGTHFLTERSSDAHELANAVLVDSCEGIVFVGVSMHSQA